MASRCGLDIKTWSDLISRMEKGEQERAVPLRGSEMHVENNNDIKNILQKVSPGMSDAIFHECFFL